MNFELTEEHKMIRDAARDFAQTELLPGVIERDENQTFPAEQIKKLGELGFLGMMVDPKYGGAGMDAVSYVLAMEEISKVDASCSVIMSVNNSLVCWGLETFGTEEQKQKYLKPLATGEIIGAFCLSEPEAGSDATSQQTTAIDKGDHYLLNGTKNWITNGNSASVYLVIAQTDVEKKHKGINAFIVEKGMDGFIVGPKENKLGISTTYTVQLRNNTYNALSEKNIEQIHYIKSLGHCIALHQNPPYMSEKDLKEYVLKDIETLEHYYGFEVDRYAFHRPKQEQLAMYLEIPGKINCYGKKYFHYYEA